VTDAVYWSTLNEVSELMNPAANTAGARQASELCSRSRL
jgi:hypothetical protein